MMTPIMVAINAFLLDAIIADPNSKFHPVALMGRLIGFLERLMNRESFSDSTKLVMGLLFAVFLLVISYLATAGLLYAAGYLGLPPLGRALLEALILSFMISPKSLYRAGQKVRFSILADDLGLTQKNVSWIVGRDTERMDDGEAIRATVETIAENTTDGIISPIFFFFVGGLPLAVLYRMANTLDSMVGYKNERYLYFGRASARIDDILNLIPARLTGLLFVLSALVLHFDAKNSLRIMARDAKKHPSPNGGYPEAAMAGALHIRLGGQNYYFGVAHFRAYMGDFDRPFSSLHILQASQMMYTATILFLIIAALTKGFF